MPKKSMKPCCSPYCPELTGDRFCDKHRKKQQKGYDKWRGTAAQRGYDSRWRKARLHFLRRHTLCVMCEKEGKIKAATVVDHIVVHRGDKKLFWDKRNLQALCVSCHSRKTMMEG